MKHYKHTRLIILIIILLAVLILSYFLVYKPSRSGAPYIDNNEILVNEEEVEEHIPTRIGETITVDEENVEGSYSRIEGTGLVAQQAQDHIDHFVGEITDLANDDLPQLRVEYPEFADRKYAFNVTAHYYSSENNESIVLDQYMYTAGANGNSFFSTFNQDNQGTIITLADLIPEDRRDSFVSDVKNRLNNYSLGGEKIEMFPDAVNFLSFNDFTRFAVDGDTLMLFFDKYELAAGAVGPIVLSIENYQDLLDLHS